MDERVKDSWSDDTVLPIIQLVMNEHVSSESGVIPLHATFGDADAIYLQIPASLPHPESTHAYVKILAENLASVRAASAEYQSALKAERVSDPHPESANKYQQGDFVLFMLRKFQLPDKLTPRNRGPFVVIKHTENWVTVRNLIKDNIDTFDQSDLRLFVGSPQDAFKMAQLDDNQFEVDTVLGHRGDPHTRTTCEFLVLFKDGESRWLLFTEIQDTLQFESYCRPRPELRCLLVKERIARHMQKECLRVPITIVKPGDIVFVDLRSWGPQWYSTLSLPDKDTTTYVAQCIYGVFCGSKQRAQYKIQAFFPAMREQFAVDNLFVNEYGQNFERDPSYVLVNEELVAEHKLSILEV
jgi:hypothetical protein